MAPVMRASVPLRIGADARVVSRGAAASSSAQSRSAPVSRRAVLRRSSNGTDALDLERVAQIEQEIIRQVRRRGWDARAPCGTRREEKPGPGGCAPGLRLGKHGAAFARAPSAAAVSYVPS